VGLVLIRSGSWHNHAYCDLHINGGYDAAQNFQLEVIARTIEASLADVVVLQEVGCG